MGGEFQLYYSLSDCLSITGSLRFIVCMTVLEQSLPEQRIPGIF